MTGVPGALWPKSLAGRLTLFLVIALAMAQAALVVFLSTQRDRVVEGLLHSQALNQTVTLARLVAEYPPPEADRLTTAFGSRGSCAWVHSDPPAAHSMTTQEQQLALTLNGMLHGINSRGTPVVAIEPAGGEHQRCPDSSATSQAAEASNASARDRDHPNETQFNDGDRMAALAMDVPLLDGRWLSIRTRVNLPPDFDPITILSFLLSSAAVAIVVFVVVRNQTRTLRALANASERLGRGETVAHLTTGGPIEISTATNAFNLMQERLGEFLRDRLRLLASISHDLRTPITTLRLKAEFIDDEAVRDDLIKTIDELATICEATLAFTRAEATSEDTKVLDASELVREVEQEFLLAEQPVSEQRMDEVRLACRPVALKRAVRNLIENALRYGESAQISVLAESGHATIRIDDRGPGIPEDRVADAFLPFVRLEQSRNMETGGIGLGLATARSIVTAHGGTIALTNLSPRGLRAEITLPLQESS